jgi:hypothetical protein
MESMNMFNRMKNFENRSLSGDWSKKIRKKIVHIHVLGNSNKMKLKNFFWMDKFAVSISRNENYEVRKELKSSKVNKAISYLRWIRNKYRPDNVNYDIDETANLLKIWKCSYGLQRSVDRFIIWKYAVKLEIYAEILFKEKTI